MYLSLHQSVSTSPDLAMNCLQAHPTSSTLPLRQFRPRNGTHPIPVSLGLGKATEFGAGRCSFSVQASTGPVSNAETSITEMEDEKKSEVYSNNMTQAMGAVLTYRHELGMNYDFILPNLIVGSCLQSPADVDKLRDIGVKTIFCLQRSSDLEYFNVDIGAIQGYAKECGDIEHVRAEIRDFDAFDLRMRLPDVVGQLYEVINRNGGVTYIHCTAGLGRAPAVALTYMFWILGYKLAEANSLLQSKRSCFPKLEAIKAATADILTGIAWSRITLRWKDKDYSLVEIAGLDIGWGQSIPLKLDADQGTWILERELPEGRYEYKYIVDGEWLCNKYDLLTEPNKDGHINNYIHVDGSDASDATKKLRKRLMDDDIDLTDRERLRIKQFLESEVDDA